jgi:D-threo-aldose 1-dehydrogenase
MSEIDQHTIRASDCMLPQQSSLMKQIVLFPEAPASTTLGFGTTSLMGLQSHKERLALLEMAFEAGIRHFDTAPSYGYGEAERVLGDFAFRKRHQLTITTKCGKQPPAVLKARYVNSSARRLLRLVPSLRKTLSRKAQQFSKNGVFSASAARQSLEQSLAALRTDYVDLLLLHEPTYADAASEEMCDFLEEETKRGRIRAFGCGGGDAIESIAAAKLPTSMWLQFEDNVLSRRIEKIRLTGARCITFRTFHQALATLTQWLEGDPTRYTEWEKLLQVDLRAAGALAGLLQAASHFRNPDGIVLFSTHRADRIRSAVQVVSRNEPSREQLGMFDTLAKNICAHP